VILFDDVALTLVHDSLNYIEVVGGENIIPFMEISSENGVITFENNNRCNFTRIKEDLSVYYHCTNVDSIQLNGFGKLSNLSKYKGDLYIESYESFSSIELDLENENTSIIGQVGSIDCKLTGVCSNLYMYSNGSGFMDASQLYCKTSHGHSQGIGDFSLRASELINIELKSRGNFMVFGSSSATKQIIIEGEGKVIYK
jgi:hypothetical protein